MCAEKAPICTLTTTLSAKRHDLDKKLLPSCDKRTQEVTEMLEQVTAEAREKATARSWLV